MTRDTNPLIIPILDILKTSSAAISEHQLLGLLALPLQEFQGLSETPQLALFQKHFLVMNALYQLQQSVADGGFFLKVSPLCIALLPHEENVKTAIIDAQEDQALRQYYLDWNNYKDTSEKDVESMLEGFWQRYIASDQQQAAYQLLGVSHGVSWEVVQQSYRRQVAEKHPDRGGSADEFVHLREAYEILARVYGQ